jgi:hypothetical protein
MPSGAVAAKGAASGSVAERGVITVMLRRKAVQGRDAGVSATP